MKIAYIADTNLPTDKAHGLQIMKTCEALAGFGAEVVLFTSSGLAGLVDRNQVDWIFEYYGLKKTFDIKIIKRPRLLSFGPLGFFVRLHLFVNRTLSALKDFSFDYVYTRDEVVGLRLSQKGYWVFFEMHDVRRSSYQKKLIKKALGIICISKGLANYCLSKGIEAQKILVAPDGVDLSEFGTKDVPKNGVIETILYSGHLYSWKGASTLAEAAKLLSHEVTPRYSSSGGRFAESTTEVSPRYRFVFVGGTPWDLEKFRQKYAGLKNIDILGPKPRKDIPAILKSADLLVLPNSAKEDISRLYTSPLKMFEYMASAKPIIASDLPSIREVLNENNALFFEADNAQSLAETIKYALAHKDKIAILANQARRDVLKFSWDERAKKILDFMSKAMN